MVRKTSDIALLLGSRGRVRKPSGFAKVMRGLFDGWSGRSAWREERPARGRSVPAWIAVAGLVAAFGGGYLVGGSFAAPAPGDAALHAPRGRSPAMIEFDSRPLASNAFVVAAYPDVPVADARDRAAALSGFLRSRGLEKARPYEYPTDSGGLWVVAVYFDGDRERAETRDRLTGLPEAVPDESFVQLRKTEAGWPKSFPIR